VAWIPDQVRDDKPDAVSIASILGPSFSSEVFMKIFFAIKSIAACAILAGAAPAFSHIVLETKSAPAGSSYKAVFLVGHGCQGSATTGVAVQIPAGFLGAKPYPKPGWTVSTQLGKLAKPHESHGRQVTEDVTLVSWKAASGEAALPDAFF
jgi:uncharacterized protein YcnI